MAKQALGCTSFRGLAQVSLIEVKAKFLRRWYAFLVGLVVLAAIASLAIMSQTGPVRGDPLRAQLAVGGPIPIVWVILATVVGAHASHDTRVIKGVLTPTQWLRHSKRSIARWSLGVIGFVGLTHVAVIAVSILGPTFTEPSLWAWLVVVAPGPAIVAGAWLIGAAVGSRHGGLCAGLTVSVLIIAEAMGFKVMNILTVDNDMSLVGQRAHSLNASLVLAVWCLAVIVALWAIRLNCLEHVKQRSAQVITVYLLAGFLVVGNRIVDAPEFSLVSPEAGVANSVCVEGRGYSVCGPRGTGDRMEAALPTLDKTAGVMRELDVPIKRVYYYYTLSNAHADLPTIMIGKEGDPSETSETFDLVTGISVPRSCPQFKDDGDGPQWLDAASRFSTDVTDAVEEPSKTLPAQKRRDLRALGRALAACDPI